MSKLKTKKKPQKKRCRHDWGPMVEHSFEDGTYQECKKCGAGRFDGDRYAYGSRGGW